MVTLYEREGCHLCAEAYRALRRISLDRALRIERVDITRDAAVERRYLVRIPVLRIDGREVDAAGLSDGEIARWIGAGASAEGSP